MFSKFTALTLHLTMRVGLLMEVQLHAYVTSALDVCESLLLPLVALPVVQVWTHPLWTPWKKIKPYCTPEIEQ
jgi:hypothetical protein